MKKIPSDTEFLEELLLPARRARMASVLAQRTESLTLLLENVKNPHNLSAIFRSADAFGLAEVHMIGADFEHMPKVSLGSERWLRVTQHHDVEAALKYLESRQYELVVTAAPLSPVPESSTNAARIQVIPISELPFERRLVIAFGNEHKGVSESLLERAKYRAFIPMYGFVESFNVSVACAITLYASTLSDAVCKRRTAPLSNEYSDGLYEEWLRRSVKNADGILANKEQAFKEQGIGVKGKE